jgi:hypothetical protein
VLNSQSTGNDFTKQITATNESDDPTRKGFTILINQDPDLSDHIYSISLMGRMSISNIKSPADAVGVTIDNARSPVTRSEI